MVDRPVGVRNDGLWIKIRQLQGENKRKSPKRSDFYELGNSIPQREGLLQCRQRINEAHIPGYDHVIKTSVLTSQNMPIHALKI